MLQSLVHTSRVTRRNITKSTYNNNSAELIDNALFGAPDTGINLVLSAIESIDTASLTGTVNIDLVLSALEAVDSSNITAGTPVRNFCEHRITQEHVRLRASICRV